MGARQLLHKNGLDSHVAEEPFLRFRILAETRTNGADVTSSETVQIARHQRVGRGGCLVRGRELDLDLLELDMEVSHLVARIGRLLLDFPRLKLGVVAKFRKDEVEPSVDKLSERLGLQSGGQKVLRSRLLQIHGGGAERRANTSTLRTEKAWKDEGRYDKADEGEQKISAVHGKKGMIWGVSRLPKGLAEEATGIDDAAHMRLLRHGAVVADHVEVTGGNEFRRCIPVARETDVGLIERYAVNQTPPVAELHRLAREGDDALDEHPPAPAPAQDDDFASARKPMTERKTVAERKAMPGVGWLHADAVKHRGTEPKRAHKHSRDHHHTETRGEPDVEARCHKRANDPRNPMLGTAGDRLRHVLWGLFRWRRDDTATRQFQIWPLFRRERAAPSAEADASAESKAPEAPPADWSVGCGLVGRETDAATGERLTRLLWFIRL